MPTIIVTPDPVSVAVELGIPDVSNSVVWSGSCQNVDAQETVYRLRAPVKPTRGTPGFRHPAGDRWRMNVYGDEPTWLWVRSRFRHCRSAIGERRMIERLMLPDCEVRAEAGRRLVGEVMRYGDVSPSHRERFAPGALRLADTVHLDLHHHQLQAVAWYPGGGLELRADRQGVSMVATVPPIPRWRPRP